MVRLGYAVIPVLLQGRHSREFMRTWAIVLTPAFVGSLSFWYFWEEFEALALLSLTLCLHLGYVR